MTPGPVEGSDLINRTAISMALACAAVLIFARTSLVSMAGLWELSSYAHAWLIPFISGYLLWLTRDQWMNVAPVPSWGAAVLFLGAVWMWTASRLALIQGIEHLAVWLMLNTGLWFALGWAVYRAVMIPFLYLFFALPIGMSLVPPLMEITAAMSWGLLDIAGIPTLRSGMIFTLPGGAFEIAEVCSGYRYLNAGLCIAALFAYFLFHSPLKAAAFIAASAAFFVLINGVRAAIVMAVASGSDMRYLAGEDHILFGWVLFVLGMVAMYFAGYYFADDARSPAA